MPWITLDCEIGGHPKIAALPSDAARYGWVLALTEAKKQRKPGAFASEQHFRHVMGRHGRFVGDYLRVGLLDQAPDASLAVHDWQRHQWAAAKAAQRDGQREDTVETNGGHEVDASRAVTVPVLVGVLETENGSRPHDDDGLPEVVRWLASRKVAVRPGSKIETDLATLVDQHDAAAVIAAMGSLQQPLHDAAQYVYGARNELNPLPSSRRSTSAKGYQPDMEAIDAFVQRDFRKVPG